MSSISNECGVSIKEIIIVKPKCPPEKPLGEIHISATYTGKETLLFSINGGEKFQESSHFVDLEPGRYSVVVEPKGNPKCQLRPEKPVEIPQPECPDHCREVDTTCGTILFPGDLMISGFDNNILHGTDRILMTTLVDLKPNTSFCIANVLYEGGAAAGEETGLWTSSGSSGPDAIASHHINYIGKSIIKAGSIICFDLPSFGNEQQLLSKNFKVNGIASRDFCVFNNGNTSVPRVNISTTKPDSLFLLQGEWEFKGTHAEFCGRPISAIQHGAYWLWSDSAVPFPGRCSRYHPLIRCFSIQAKGSPSKHAGFFAAQSGFYYPLDYIQAVMNYDDWNFLKPTEKNDIPDDACKKSFFVGNPCAEASA